MYTMYKNKKIYVICCHIYCVLHNIAIHITYPGVDSVFWHVVDFNSLRPGGTVYFSAFGGEGPERSNDVHMRHRIAISTALLTITATWCAFVTADAGIRTITLQEGGTVRTIQTQAASVAEMLREANIGLKELDRCVPSPKEPLADGMEVTVTRIERRTETDRVTLPRPVRRFADRTIRPGVVRVVQEGRDGLREDTYQVYLADGKEVARKRVASKTAVEPKSRVEAFGTGQALLSRSGHSTRRVLDMLATGYAPRVCGGSRTGRTATGVRAGYGKVAVDPRVIPLGSRLYIEGYGYAIAADTGGAVKGHRIDLGHETRRDALRVGRQRVKVYVLD